MQFGLVAGSAVDSFRKNTESFTRQGVMLDENARADAEESRRQIKFGQQQSDRAAEQRSYQSNLLGGGAVEDGPPGVEPLGVDTGGTTRKGTGLQMGTLSVGAAEANYRNDPNKFTYQRYVEAKAAESAATRERYDILTKESNLVTAEENRKTARQNREINALGMKERHYEMARKQANDYTSSAINYVQQLDDSLPVADEVSGNWAKTKMALNDLQTSYEFVPDGNRLEYTPNSNQTAFDVKLVNGKTGEKVFEKRISSVQELRELVAVNSSFSMKPEEYRAHVTGAYLANNADALMEEAKAIQTTNVELAKSKARTAQAMGKMGEMLSDPNIDVWADFEKLRAVRDHATSVGGDAITKSFKVKTVDAKGNEIEEVRTVNILDKILADRMGQLVSDKPTPEGTPMTVIDMDDEMAKGWSTYTAAANGDPAKEKQIMRQYYARKGFRPETADMHYKNVLKLREMYAGAAAEEVATPKEIKGTGQANSYQRIRDGLKAYNDTLRKIREAREAINK